MITIFNLEKSFNGHRVFNKLNLEIKQGETIGVIGCSGCGKSLLLKHIIGIVKPDAGAIILDGEDITKMNESQLDMKRKQFGMLFQEAALFDSLTVAENVGFALREHTGMDEEGISRVVREKLAMVGLHNVEQLMPAELSGGMRKRVGLARAIAMSPRTVLYDEPTTGVDPVMADVINKLIVELHDQLNITSVVVTHDMKSVYAVADRIAMLYDGKIIEVGTVAEIQASSSPIVQQFINGNGEGPLTVDRI